MILKLCGRIWSAAIGALLLLCALCFALFCVLYVSVVFVARVVFVFAESPRAFCGVLRCDYASRLVGHGLCSVV